MKCINTYHKLIDFTVTSVSYKTLTDRSWTSQLPLQTTAAQNVMGLLWHTYSYKTLYHTEKAAWSLIKVA